MARTPAGTVPEPAGSVPGPFAAVLGSGRVAHLAVQHRTPPAAGIGHDTVGPDIAAGRDLTRGDTEHPESDTVVDPAHSGTAAFGLDTAAVPGLPTDSTVTAGSAVAVVTVGESDVAAEPD